MINNTENDKLWEYVDGKYYISLKNKTDVKREIYELKCTGKRLTPREFTSKVEEKTNN